MQYHGQRKVRAAVFLLCFWQSLGRFIKPAPCMGPASGNLQVFPFVFDRVVDLVPVCDTDPTEILQELPRMAGIARLLVFIQDDLAVRGTMSRKRSRPFSDASSDPHQVRRLYRAYGHGDGKTGLNPMYA